MRLKAMNKNLRGGGLNKPPSQVGLTYRQSYQQETCQGTGLTQEPPNAPCEADKRGLFVKKVPC